jgi:DNA polymerase-3 subunit epsilon
MELALQRYWVIDVEGNGGTPPEIVELAITEVSNLTIGSRQWDWLVRPENPIHQGATRIHGLSDDDVVDAPSIDDIAGDIMTWTDGAKIVGHNVKIEVDIITRAIPEWRPIAAIDTLKLAKALRPGLESYSLERLGSLLDIARTAEEISGKRHHRALYDTTLTALLFINLLAGLPEAKRSVALLDADILSSRQGTLL